MSKQASLYDTPHDVLHWDVALWMLGALRLAARAGEAGRNQELQTQARSKARALADLKHWYVVPPLVDELGSHLTTYGRTSTPVPPATLEAAWDTYTAWYEQTAKPSLTALIVGTAEAQRG